MWSTTPATQHKRYNTQFVMQHSFHNSRSHFSHLNSNIGTFCSENASGNVQMSTHYTTNSAIQVELRSDTLSYLIRTVLSSIVPSLPRRHCHRVSVLDGTVKRHVDVRSERSSMDSSLSSCFVFTRMLTGHVAELHACGTCGCL
jgi:hypothetical protein